MSIILTLVTTANRTRRFKQSDPQRITEILESLGRCAQLFSQRSLVVAADHSTHIFSPASLTRIEIETSTDLTPYLPAGSNVTLRALALGEAIPEIEINDTLISVPIDLFFEGGDTLSMWLDNNRPADAIERTMRISRLFEQPVLIYRPTTPGIGLINPQAMTRAAVGAALPDVPAGSWYASEG